MKKAGTRHAQISRIALLTLAALCLSGLSYFAVAQDPDWWSARGVIESQVSTDDFAAANSGQLKNIALQAYYELEAKMPATVMEMALNLPDGSTGTLADHISAFADPLTGDPTGESDPYAAVNIGQLKAVAKPFYELLNGAGYTIEHPWTSDAQDDDNFAVANIGQLKYVFSFDVALSAEISTPDSLPDWWETLHYSDPALYSDHDDIDSDGISMLEEYYLGLDPVEPALTGDAGLDVWSPIN